MIYLTISLIIVSAFISGAIWGLNQVLYHKNKIFFKIFPNASDNFWGIDSWKNKYVYRDPKFGRNNVPIWFTDGKHLTASITQVLLFSMGFLFIFIDVRWYIYIILIIIVFLFYYIGNWLVWDRIFK